MNEQQLHTLRTCYAANPRPDALMKEQLVEMTGLNSRVIRVWFQNKRCKDKKKAILMKNIQDAAKAHYEYSAGGVVGPNSGGFTHGFEQATGFDERMFYGDYSEAGSSHAYGIHESHGYDNYGYSSSVQSAHSIPTHHVHPSPTHQQHSHPLQNHHHQHYPIPDNKTTTTTPEPEC